MLEGQFAELLGRMNFDDEVMEWVRVYVDKLDGRVDVVFFERMSAEWRAEQDRCLSEISGHQGAEQSYFEEGVRILEFARNARRLFEKQEPREKRRLLQFVVSNCTWQEGLLTAELRQPFDCVINTKSLKL